MERLRLVRGKNLIWEEEEDEASFIKKKNNIMRLRSTRRGNYHQGPNKQIGAIIVRSTVTKAGLSWQPINTSTCATHYPCS